jgi:aspartate/methionine/tyrosine aminotransferase
MKKIQDAILVCPPLISQAAAVGAMNAGRAYCLDHLRALSEMRESVREVLENIGDFCDAPPTDGTFYYFIKLDTDMHPLRLVERLVRECGVAAIPGNAFGMEGCSLRVSYGALNKETADEGMHRLAQGVRRILRRL